MVSNFLRQTKWEQEQELKNTSQMFFAVIESSFTKILKEYILEKTFYYPKNIRSTYKESKRLTSTQGSHAGFFGSEGIASTIPVGGPRKLSQTSRKRDSSASLQSK